MNCNSGIILTSLFRVLLSYHGEWYVCPVNHGDIPALNSAVNPVLAEALAPAPAASANPTQIWSFVLARLWLAGVILLLLYALVSYLRLRRRVSTATLLRENIRQSEWVDTPFVLGLLRPVIYLPYRLEERDLSYVIAHERAHIRRGDHWWKALGFLLLSVYWFHPLLWAAYALLCRDIEGACDEKVIRALEQEDRRGYAAALFRCGVRRRTVAACPLAFGEVGVKARVKAVMGYRRPGGWLVAAALIACAAAAVCFLTDPVVRMEEIRVNDRIYTRQGEAAETLPGAADGYRYIFVLRPEGLLDPMVWVYALGQAFFSLSVAGNGTLIYGSYLAKDADVPEAARTVAFFDTMAAVLSALVIIPAMATAGETLTQSGPGLMFIYLPNLFREMPGGRVLMAVFFVAALFAGVTSLVNLYEAPIATLQEKLHLRRGTAVAVIGTVGLAVGLCIQGIVSGWMDVCSIYACPVGALLAGVCFFWICRREWCLEQVNLARRRPLRGRTGRPLCLRQVCGLSRRQLPEPSEALYRGRLPAGRPHRQCIGDHALLHRILGTGHQKRKECGQCVQRVPHQGSAPGHL